MNEPKINITVMPGAQMNGYVKEQHNYFGTVQQITKAEEQQQTPGEAEEANAAEPNQTETRTEYKVRDEERFHFVHPEIEEEEAWRIHDAVKRLVAYQKVPEICAYLKELRQKGKVLLPQSPAVMYSELKRLGMPTGDGYSEKHFTNSYMK